MAIKVGKAAAVLILVLGGWPRDASPARSAPFLPQSLSTGLVGYWPLDAIDGTTTPDVSPTTPSNPATLNGGPAVAAGKIANGFVFTPASSQFLSVADAASLQFGTSSFSVALWAMPANLTNKLRVINKWDDAGFGWLLDFNSEAGGGDLPGAVRFRLNDVSNNNTVLVTASGVLTSTTTFVHVAAVADRTAGVLRLYLDGVEIAPSPQPIAGSPDLSQPGISLGIGALVNNPANFYSGMLDDVRVYNRVLTPTEIQSLATFTGPPTAPTNLTAATPPWRRVDLTWTPGSQVGDYDVERSPQGMNAWTNLTPLGLSASTTSYSDLTVTPGVSYDYRVVAVNPYGTAASLPVTAVPPVPPPKDPPKNHGTCGCSVAGGSPSGLALLGLLLVLLRIATR